jgi:DNA-binding Xre family transcriptional regulator
MMALVRSVVAVGKLKYKARMLRLELRQKEGRAVTVQEVAEATGLDRYRLSRIELGNIKEIKTEELQALCAYYSERLGRLVDTNEITGFDPNNKKAFGQPLLRAEF